jgi:phosphohistidine phosphatase SixA
MMRHADAPGYSDPEGFDLKNCATQRNLGENGRQQARELGEWLKAMGISYARILSSPWCRCQDTANLLNLGSVQTEHSLGSFFENRSAENKQMHQLRQKIQAELMHATEKPLILVTHQVNIQAFTGISVSSGQIVLVEVSSDGQYMSHQIISKD